MVGLVDDQPMLPRALDAKAGQGRDEFRKKARPFGNIDLKEVRHDVPLGFAEKLDNFGQSRRRLGIAQDHSAFEIGIVAFRGRSRKAGSRVR